MKTLRKPGSSCGALLCLLPALFAATDRSSGPSKSIVPEPMAADYAGFVTLFDGQTFRGWEADTAYWRIENGCIVGETTPQHPLRGSNLVIWRGGILKDFELKLEYRISRAGNSGVFYRCLEPSAPKWNLDGYQADIDGPDWIPEASPRLGPLLSQMGVEPPRITGQNYEDYVGNVGRQFLSVPGQFTTIPDGGVQRTAGYLGTGPRINAIATDGWNAMHIIARGNVMIHVLNGQVVSVVIDDDKAHRRFEGKLGLQLHPGPPMKVEFRNIWLKTIEALPGY